MGRFPDVVIIVRSKKNFANIGKVRIIGSASPCLSTLKVGSPVKDAVLCVAQAKIPLLSPINKQQPRTRKQ